MSRPSLRRRFATASSIPGSTSAMGRNCLASALVSGRTTSPSLFVRGFFDIPIGLALIGLAKADDAASSAADREAYHVDPALQRNIGDETFLAIRPANVRTNDRLRPIAKHDHFERKPTAQEVLETLAGVKLDFQPSAPRRIVGRKAFMRKPPLQPPRRRQRIARIRGRPPGARRPRGGGVNPGLSLLVYLRLQQCNLIGRLLSCWGLRNP